MPRAHAPRPPPEAAAGTQQQVSSHAVGTAELTFVRYFDLLVLVMALPFFLGAGLPLLGWGAAAGAWLGQRGLGAFLERRAKESTEIRTVAGLMTASMIMRGWIVALAIFGAGLIEREAGLSAAVLSLAVVSVYFSMRMVTR
jgi:hypothetical protein